MSHVEGYGTTTLVTGVYGHAEGSGTKVTGQAAHAEGVGTHAHVTGAHAEGFNTQVSGEFAHTMGIHTHSRTFGETVVGAYNTFISGTKELTDYTDITGTWVNGQDYSAGAAEPTKNAAFVVGTGFNTNTKSNGLVVWKSGDTSISGTTRIVGNTWVTGNINCSKSVCSQSDARLKTDIETMECALDKIDSIRGVTYKWKDENRDSRVQYGVIAQEIEHVLPSLVVTDSVSDIKSVDYPKLVSVLINGIKELKDRVEDLEEKVQSLENNA